MGPACVVFRIFIVLSVVTKFCRIKLEIDVIGLDSVPTNDFKTKSTI
jgi:hypothetical protein